MTMKKYGKFTVKDLVDACARVAASSVDHMEEALAPEAFWVAEAGVESHIELLFAVAMDAACLIFRHPGYVSVRRNNTLPVTEEGSPIDYWLVPQVERDLPDRKVRIDFVIVDAKTLKPVVAIECDGHEFHERTKEQAQRDRSRDRLIQRDGLPVFRFTGSEIFRDPCECALETLHFLDTRS